MHIYLLVYAVCKINFVWNIGDNFIVYQKVQKINHVSLKVLCKLFWDLNTCCCNVITSKKMADAAECFINMSVIGRLICLEITCTPVT